MKLVNPKSLIALFLVIIVLIASLSYMSYNVVSTVSIAKSPAEIIDSLKNELKEKELMILSLQKNTKVHTGIGSAFSTIQTTQPSIEKKTSVRNDQPKMIKAKQSISVVQIDTSKPIFVGF
jgi:hypothetical protein